MARNDQRDWQKTEWECHFRWLQGCSELFQLCQLERQLGRSKWTRVFLRWTLVVPRTLFSLFRGMATHGQYIYCCHLGFSTVQRAILIIQEKSRDHNLTCNWSSKLDAVFRKQLLRAKTQDRARWRHWIWPAETEVIKYSSELEAGKVYSHSVVRWTGTYQW